ncbi:MAG: HD domain-containing protein [Lachnospiraceae bacterium]|nr:HD domain-containing protein [Lachnospiraceae bacterium]
MSHEKYNLALRELKNDEAVKRMQEFKQHGSSNTYLHSVHVAETAKKLADRFHVDVHERDLARGAMLHDFFLYNFHEQHEATGLKAWHHLHNHPSISLVNADRLFHLTEIEKDIIHSHMWPLNIRRVPKYKESVLVNLADKYCSFMEFVQHYTNLPIYETK